MDSDCAGGDPVCPVCVDEDLDGFFVDRSCLTLIDCDDSDEGVNPAAVEICNDGIDQNCDPIDDFCLEFPPPPGGPRFLHVGEPIVLFAINGAPNGADGLDLIEAAEVVRDVTAPDFAELTPFTAQNRPGSNARHTLGQRAVLYDFSSTEAYLLVWGGARSHTPGTEPSANSKSSFPYDASGGPDGYFDSFQSTAGGPAESRTYYALVRLFGFLWAVGGNAGAGPIATTGYTTQ